MIVVDVIKHDIGKIGMICQALEHEAVSQTHAFEWYNYFKEGQESVDSKNCQEDQALPRILVQEQWKCMLCAERKTELLLQNN